MVEIIKRNKHIIIGAVCVFLLFAYMTYVTPLLGDDWGFAINGQYGNPFITALSFYKSWSGRILSETFCFTAASHPIIYKILNPLLYTIIFILICKIVDSNKKILIPLLVFTLMVTINKDLRMETYTWLTGEIYVISLCLSLLYYYVLTKIIVKKSIEKKYKIYLYLLNIALLIIGLMMENIGGAMILGIIILLIYDYFKNKRILKPLVINLLVSIISFSIVRLSPGAQTRLINEHYDWSNLNIVEKIIGGYPGFINMTFINNNYLILFLSFALIYLVITSKKTANKLLKLLLIVVQAIGPCALFSFVILGSNNIFLQKNSIFSLSYWPIYLISVFIIIILYFENGFDKEKCLFFLVVGGSCSVAMLLSPIYGPRSSVYTVFYLFICISLILSNIEVNRIINLVLIIVCLGLSSVKTYTLIKKYHEVRVVTQKRNQEAKYAIEHSNELEAWFTAYPVDSVHSGNPDDDYHLQTFAEYLGIPQSYKHVVFYYDENGISVRLNQEK